MRGVRGLSLVLPSAASYDPWAWLVWGRELAHLHLDTTGGPSWKPLPVLVTALASPLSALGSGLPAAIWMTVARAGSLLALALAFRLTRRLSGGGIPGTIAGVFAACALFLVPDWFQFAAQGSEAPIAIALILWAVERQLDARPEHAVVLATLACLLRPELSRSWSFSGRSCGAPRRNGGLCCRRHWSCLRWRGSCPSGSARAIRSTVASRLAVSRPGACRMPSRPGCVRFGGSTTTLDC